MSTVPAAERNRQAGPRAEYPAHKGLELQVSAAPDRGHPRPLQVQAFQFQVENALLGVGDLYRRVVQIMS